MWKEGRLLLQQYVEEVGYTDTMLDMLSKRAVPTGTLTGDQWGCGAQ